ncbi:hypothetical protein C8J56DRAFT_924750 [Mycena floridula]|nr:hypothetical protein C8J56DRAFT_924750 [Mycena floridula]
MAQITKASDTKFANTDKKFETMMAQMAQDTKASDTKFANTMNEIRLLTTEKLDRLLESQTKLTTMMEQIFRHKNPDPGPMHELWEWCRRDGGLHRKDEEFEGFKAKFLVLPKGMPFLYDTNLLVRDEYDRMEKVILDSSKKSKWAVIVWGHPGMGKSVFLLYLLCLLLQKRLPVLLCRVGYSYQLFNEEGVWSLNPSIFVHAQDICAICPAGTVALVNGDSSANPAPTILTATDGHFNVVLAASPRDPTIKPVQKNLDPITLIPLHWNINELCVAALNRGLATRSNVLQFVIDRCERAGPVARLVLGSPQRNVQFRRDQDLAIQNLKYPDVVQLLERVKSTSLEMTHKMILLTRKQTASDSLHHFVSDAAAYDFLTPSVVPMVLDRCSEQEQSELSHLGRLLCRDPSTRSLGGHLFEPFVHRKICDGLSGASWNMPVSHLSQQKSESEKNWRLYARRQGSSQPHVFQAMRLARYSSGLPTEPSVVHIPQQRNNPLFDSYFISPEQSQDPQHPKGVINVFSVTTAVHQTCSSTGMQKIFDNFAGYRKVVWKIVPDDDEKHQMGPIPQIEKGAELYDVEYKLLVVPWND